MFQRCYTLMRPWICAGIAGIIYHIFRIIIAVVVGFTTELPFGNIILVVLVGLLVVGKLWEFFFFFFDLNCACENSSKYYLYS